MEELKNKSGKKQKTTSKSSTKSRKQSIKPEIEENTRKAVSKPQQSGAADADMAPKKAFELSESAKKATSEIVKTIKKVTSNISDTTRKVVTDVAEETKKVTSDIADKTKEAAPDIADKTKKFAASVAEKAGETLNRGKLQTRLFDLRSKLKRKSAELGGISFDMLKDKKTAVIYQDKRVKELLTEMKDLKSRIKATEKELKEI